MGKDYNSDEDAWLRIPRDRAFRFEWLAMMFETKTGNLQPSGVRSRTPPARFPNRMTLTQEASRF
jgi:hypothetical protein